MKKKKNFLFELAKRNSFVGGSGSGVSCCSCFVGWWKMRKTRELNASYQKQSQTYVNENL
jgi:hypothetical protein